MSLRSLLIERVLYALDPEELEQRYHVTEEEVETMSDLDLFELYESVYLDESR